MFFIPSLAFKGGDSMKFKALKSFVSGFGTFDADQKYDVKLDKPTQKMWIDHGLIEEVKVAKDDQKQDPVKTVKKTTKSKKSVNTDEDK